MMRDELNFDEDKVNDVLVVGGASYDLKGCCDIMNEQQATINRLEEEIKLLKPTNVEQYEQIVQLQEEKEQLKKKLESLQKVLHLVECVSDE